jgi:hypothetical protein
MNVNWPLRAIAAVIIVAGFVGDLVNAAGLVGGLPPIFVVVAAAYLAVGTLIVERRSGNRIGPILYAIGLLISGYLIADAIVMQPDPPEAAVYVAWAVTLIDAPLFALVAFLFLLFPDGHFQSPTWRWVGLAVVVFGAIALIGTAVIPGPFAYYPDLSNPFGVAGQPLSDVMPTFYLLTIVGVALAALSLIGRWRAGGPAERAQLKWVAAAAALNAVVMASYAILFGPGRFNDVMDIAVGVAVGCFPIAIGIAILRYHLFEIDRVVSRTISYAVVTALLVGTYAAVILILQGPLGAVTGGDTVSVALSTLVAAALFQPLRARVQSAVDRRFDRARFDAERTATSFAERLRHEVDIAMVTADLDSTVRSAIKPVSLGLWLREGASG